jgi:hypothetical protein
MFASGAAHVSASSHAPAHMGILDTTTSAEAAHAWSMPTTEMSQLYSMDICHRHSSTAYVWAPQVIRSFPRMLDTSTVNYQQVLALVAHLLSQHCRDVGAASTAAATAGCTTPHCGESKAAAWTCKTGSNCTEETSPAWRIGVATDSRPGSAERPSTADDLAHALDDFADIATVHSSLGSATPSAQVQGSVYAGSRQLRGLGAAGSAAQPCISSSTPTEPEDLNAVPEGELLQVKVRDVHSRM